MLNLINTSADSVTRGIKVDGDSYSLWLNGEKVLTGEIPQAFFWPNKRAEPKEIGFNLVDMGNNTCGVHAYANFEHIGTRETRKSVVLYEPKPQPFNNPPESLVIDKVKRFVSGRFSLYGFGQNYFDQAYGYSNDVFTSIERTEAFEKSNSSRIISHFSANQGYLAFYMPTPFGENYETEAIYSIGAAKSMEELTELAGIIFKQRLLSMLKEESKIKPFLESVPKDAFTWYLWSRFEYAINWQAREIGVHDAPPSNLDTFYNFPHLSSH
jgi:hypothetical protein